LRAHNLFKLKIMDVKMGRGGAYNLVVLLKHAILRACKCIDSKSNTIKYTCVLLLKSV